MTSESEFKIVPTPDANDPLTGKPTGEHDILMLARGEALWDWIGTYASKREARAELLRIKSERAAIDEAQRNYEAQYAYACGYYD